MDTNHSERTSRRAFLAGGAAAAAAAAAMRHAPAAYANESGELRVGLIGCGSRGTGAARQALLADPHTRLVALGDVFPDAIENSHARLKDSEVGDRVTVDEDHKFAGFDNFAGVIAASDVLVLAGPPVFRPRHLRAAIDAGCHVFCEKPVAVDPAGVRSVLDTCRIAKEKRLNVVTGLCYRYEFAKRDVIDRVLDGALGDIIAVETVYNTGGLWHRGREPEWSEMEYQIRNWIYFNWLSGDHIVEQHIHSLDKVAWALGNVYPVKATASGGRSVRIDPKYGNVWDHFNTMFEWENGVRGYSSCRQWESASTNVSDTIMGTKGTAHLMTHRINFRDGSRWAHRPDGPDDMYQNEHNELFAAIRADEPINDGEIMSHSTLMGIMARISAYTGRTVTWEEMMNSELDLMPDTLEWGDLEMAPIPIPGVTPLA